MAAAKQTDVPEERLELYRALLAAVPGVAEKSNFGSAYTAVNGNMYSMISKHGVVGLRLPADERAAFIERYATDLFRGDPAWPPAKEFVAVPDGLLERTERARAVPRAQLPLHPDPQAEGDETGWRMIVRSRSGAVRLRVAEIDFVVAAARRQALRDNERMEPLDRRPLGIAIRTDVEELGGAALGEALEP